MGIESTRDVKRTDALSMLRQKGLKVYDNDCNERLEDMLYENRESIFENYNVVDNNYTNDSIEQGWANFKTSWND